MKGGQGLSPIRLNDAKSREACRHVIPPNNKLADSDYPHIPVTYFAALFYCGGCANGMHSKRAVEKLQ